MTRNKVDPDLGDERRNAIEGIFFSGGSHSCEKKDLSISQSAIAEELGRAWAEWYRQTTSGVSPRS